MSTKQRTIPDTPYSRVADPISFNTDPDIGFLENECRSGYRASILNLLEKNNLFPVELGGKSKKI